LPVRRAKHIAKTQQITFFDWKEAFFPGKISKSLPADFFLVKSAKII
jgi:hypothetical protein